MTDENLEDIVEQNDFHIGRRDGRGAKVGTLHKQPISRLAKLRQQLSAARHSSPWNPLRPKTEISE